MTVSLDQEQARILELLVDASGPVDMKVLADRLGLDQSKVSATLVQWSGSGWTEIRENKREEIVPGAEFDAVLVDGLPERRMLDALGGRAEAPMREVSALGAGLGIKTGDAVKFGGRKGWFAIEKGVLRVLRGSGEGPDEDERALQAVRDGRLRYLDEAEALGLNAGKLREILDHRGGVVKLKERTMRFVSLTADGRRELSDARTLRAASRLTSDDIASGAWREVRLKPFDVTLKAEDAFPVKPHPLQRILEETRRAFLEMGFREIVSPQVESAFWNFDALFQPQDHPARDMQDTFYLKTPAEADLPDPACVERVRRTHEDGWETGSRGWGYRWDPERARQTVLRTHTTASTIRAVAAHPDPPLKVFCVGKNYRNEAISYKHLPEFHQVDGIIIDEKASFAVLLGTLKEFYRKLGFEKVHFKPAFFPYTEPSAEVFGWMPGHETWIELGGSGVFRPEVTEPFGCRWPVLAWGQGLERLAMLRYGLNDIRTLYRSELDWLRRVPLCR